MTQKLVSNYIESKNAGAAENDQLIIEISSSEIACLVKNKGSQEIEEFELFRLEKDITDWSDILFELRSISNLVNRSFRDVQCYYNFEEAVIIPEEKFSISSSEDYLALVYGESNRQHTRYDTLSSDVHLVNAYRIKKSITEWVGRQFILSQPHHIYSQILNDLLKRDLPEGYFVKIQLYSYHIIVVLFKNSTLQLIQSFHYQSPEDILYHVLNITQQFNIGDAQSHLELSGIIDPGSSIYFQLTGLFSQSSIETIEGASDAFKQNDYPLHYFTPYYKLGS